MHHGAFQAAEEDKWRFRGPRTGVGEEMCGIVGRSGHEKAETSNMGPGCGETEIGIAGSTGQSGGDKSKNRGRPSPLGW